MRAESVERRRPTRADDRRLDRDFARLLLRCEASPTYRRFCRRVYGVDLCQTNVLDRPQLELLVEVLDLDPGERALDLGCGLGTLTEHLSDRTGARLVGVDRCAAAVRAARRRVRAKGHRLELRWGDLRDLPDLVPPADPPAASEPVRPPGGWLAGDASWNALIAVDSLYFLDDLDAVVSVFPRLLAPGGRGVVFASELLPDGVTPPEPEIPSHTRIGRALVRHGLRFEARDVSDRECEVWRRHREAGRELREAFVAEGALDLLQGRLDEAERTLEWVEAGRVRRYCYRFERT